MGNGLLRYAFFVERQGKPNFWLEINHKNSKNEAAAS